jgi:energy-coupling factor transporter ATP-binding protein EcfA2
VISVVTQVIELLAQSPPSASTTRVLAVDGPSGAGKTTLAEAVRRALEAAPDSPGRRCGPSAGPVFVVHLDNLYPGWDGLAAGVTRLVEWVLRPLAEHRPVRYRRYDWAREQDAEWIDVPTDPAPAVLIVEGAGAGSLPCAPYLSLLVWLDAPVAVRFERGMARDGEAYRPHWQRWAEQENRHFAEHDPRGRAGLRLDTQHPGVA